MNDRDKHLLKEIEIEFNLSADVQNLENEQLNKLLLVLRDLDHGDALKVVAILMYNFIRLGESDVDLLEFPERLIYFMCDQPVPSPFRFLISDSNKRLGIARDFLDDLSNWAIFSGYKDDILHFIASK